MKIGGNQDKIPLTNPDDEILWAIQLFMLKGDLMRKVDKCKSF